MLKFLFTTVLALFIGFQSLSQVKVEKYKLGSGLVIKGDSNSFKLKFGLRFQSLFVSDWNVRNDNIGYVEGYKGNFLIRRARFKFDGHALKKKLMWKMELGLSNRDISGGGTEHKDASRVILDAVIKYNIVDNLWIWAGQTKLPGNRERVISSGNLQLVDRSILNSKFTLDRDMGAQLRHSIKLGKNKNFIIKEIFAFSMGEGRNLTIGNLGGFQYTGRLEFLPLGEFTKKGDYVGSDIKREQKPKLAIGTTFDFNHKSVKERGNLGSFMQDSNGNYVGKNLYTFYADMMFKYKGFSLMAEYAQRWNQGNDPNVYAGDVVVGQQYTGKSLNVQVGYLFKKGWEISARFAAVDTDRAIQKDIKEYRLGLSKYIIGHKLKVQTDFGYQSLQNKDDQLSWRLQIDLHF